MKTEVGNEQGLIPPGDASTVSGASLDTSGAVPFPRNDPEYPQYGAGAWRWPDLSPFEQGYVEAMFASFDHPGYLDVEPGNNDAGHIPVGFRHLAPETIAAIRKDCAQFLVRHGGQHHYGWSNGRDFWAARQLGIWTSEDLTPLTPTLNDAGKVVFS